jgi:death-on-curing protein
MHRARSGSGRKVPTANESKHKEKQKNSGKTRRTIRYLNREILQELHRAIILETYNMISERSHVLNPSALELALELPKKSLYGHELYPDLFEKAAVLMMELIKGHPFEAANKRTGYMAAVTFLDENGYCIESNVDDAVSLTIRIAMDKVDVEEVAGWLRKHSKRNSS